MPASPYIVQEIAGLGRGISLRGRSLPYQGLSYAATQRVEQTWNPGNPTATIQIDGPEYDDVTINGMWKDTFLFDPENAPVLSDFVALIPAETGTPRGGSPIAMQEASRAEIAMFAFEQLRKAASPCRIEWGSIVRYGIVHKTNFTFDRIEDITWEITFKLMGEQPNQPAPSKVAFASVTDNMRSIIDKILIDRLAVGPEVPESPFDAALGLINTLQSALINIQYFRTGTSLLDITGAIAQLGFLVTELLDTLEGFANLAFFPFDVISTVTATLKRVELQATLITQRFASRAVATDASFSRNPAEVASANATQQFIRDRAKRMAADAVRVRREFEQLQAKEVLKVVIMKSGETLRDVARREYGVESDWRLIASFNGFSSSIVPAGRIIRVPEK